MEIVEIETTRELNKLSRELVAIVRVGNMRVAVNPLRLSGKMHVVEVVGTPGQARLRTKGTVSLVQGKERQERLLGTPVDAVGRVVHVEWGGEGGA